MTLEELQQSVNKDFKLDDTELDSESIKIPLLLVIKTLMV